MSTEGRLGPTARLVLEQAATVVLPSDPVVRTERNERRVSVGTNALASDGESLSDESARRWQEGLRISGAAAGTGADEAAGLCSMLVQAAVDWRRMGLFRPIAEGELRELTRLGPMFPTSEPDDARWADALSWALTAPLEATTALIEEVRAATTPAPGRAFLAADFLTSHPDLPEVPLQAWEFALRRCDAFELVGIAETARNSGRSEVVDAALQQATLSAEPFVASYAGFRLGNDRGERGDTPGAVAAYQQAVADGRTDGDVRLLRYDRSDAASDQEAAKEPAESVLAALACFSLGQSLADQGRAVEAIATYREAISMDDPISTILAAHNLGCLLADQGDIAAARSAFEQALTACAWAGDPAGVLGPTAHDLGDLLEMQGETAAALIAFEIAVDSGHSSAAPRAARRMGSLLNTRGDKVEAMAAFRLAVEAEEVETASAAQVQLAEMMEQTDPEQAVSLYRKATACGIPLVAGLALTSLGQFLHRRGDLLGAEQAFRQATEPGRAKPATAAEAALHLGMLLEQQNDTDGALSAYRETMRSGDPQSAPPAAYGAGRLLLQRRDFTNARDLLELVADSGHRRIAATALSALSETLLCMGDPLGARSAAERASLSEDPAVRQNAMGQLERVLRSTGQHRTPGQNTKPPSKDV